MSFQTGNDLRKIDLRLANCGDCTFWNNLSSIHGECRRYPPTPTDDFMEDGKTVRSEFPFTSHVHWCGEYISWESEVPYKK